MADGQWARNCVPPTCTSSSTAESRSRDGPSTGTVFTARDRHPAPESGGYRPIRGEADAEALAPWVRHVPHPHSGHCPSPELPRGRQPRRGRPAPTNRIRSASAGRVRCSHLPRSGPMINTGHCPWCGSQHPARNSAPAYGEQVDIAGGRPPIAPVPCEHSVPPPMLPNNPLKRNVPPPMLPNNPLKRNVPPPMLPNNPLKRNQERVSGGADIAGSHCCLTCRRADPACCARPGGRARAGRPPAGGAS
jgi:hypothetical protein